MAAFHPGQEALEICSVYGYPLPVSQKSHSTSETMDRERLPP